MIKHEVICDKCGKTEQLKFNNSVCEMIDLPDDWEKTGICPIYHICPKCALALNKIKQEAEYQFFKKPE